MDFTINLLKNDDHSSHPKTKSLLERLARRNKIYLFDMNVSPYLENLNTRLTVIKDIDNKFRVQIDIPEGVDESGPNPKRIFNCYSFWLEYCLEISKELDCSFLIGLNASDWGNEQFLSMTSEKESIIIPDEYSMFESQKLSHTNSWRSFSEFNQGWQNRKPIMFWRGSTTGKPIESIHDLENLQRVKSCIQYKNHFGFDMKVSNIVNNKIPKKRIKEWLSSHKIMSSKIGENAFIRYRYYPDLPGNNESCGSWGVIKKYLRGNLVFRPNYASKMYYDRYLKPWEHYIPIDKEFIDLEEKLLWSENHNEQAVKISWRGYCVAKEYLTKIKEHFKEVVISNIVKV